MPPSQTIGFINTKKIMEIKLSEIKDYLVNEQDYTEEGVEGMPIEELVDLYEMYHVD